MGLLDFWAHADAVARAVALVLVLMSVVSWSLIVYKSWWLRRVARAQTAALATFWRGESWAEGAQQALALDDGGLLGPFLQAARDHAGADTAPLTRHLRAALHAARGALEAGQVTLASVGATAPFVGLLGTVWGIHHALGNLVGAGQLGLDQVAGPVGEALVMTAAGLAVALPAVFGYNYLGRAIQRRIAVLDGFAADLLNAAGSKARRREAP
ncbi:MAG TPA: MotA/TolQ/ExbB proton channel family protein [Burkholderiaceae bacterium]|nr:MotA/TolQ/ExbB proton channel family protein [Burkholderiaceae bacterium]